jgi:YjbR
MARVASPASAPRAFALSLPGGHEDFPWGERVAKVGKKVFVFLGKSAGKRGLSLSVKLLQSSFEALELPFAQATGYGLRATGSEKPVGSPRRSTAETRFRYRF